MNMEKFFGFALRCENQHRLLQLAAVSDDNRLAGGTGLRANGFNLVQDREGGFLDLAEDDVLAIEPVGHDGAQEELRAVGVGAGVGHRQHTLSTVLVDEVFIGKLFAVDGFTARAVAAGEVTALEHEVGDHAVEGRALVVQRLARATDALFTSAQRTEVFSRLGDLVGVQFHGNAAGRHAADGHIKEHDGVGHLLSDRRFAVELCCRTLPPVYFTSL
ncbi:hypothetical protein Ae201684_007486 [Aphanomyces euteiches]|uniref:Uncharacterized protein n=1 Tax=Aphanomyces euteiches TaxID=100861 RepID=A0A6G0X942_9STRA|nr:hypothetical protein Ae201684_007486 [Aphanomyces euteiches]